MAVIKLSKARRRASLLIRWHDFGKAEIVAFTEAFLDGHRTGRHGTSETFAHAWRRLQDSIRQSYKQ